MSKELALFATLKGSARECKRANDERKEGGQRSRAQANEQSPRTPQRASEADRRIKDGGLKRAGEFSSQRRLTELRILISCVYKAFAYANVVEIRTVASRPTKRGKPLHNHNFSRKLTGQFVRRSALRAASENVQMSTARERAEKRARVSRCFVNKQPIDEPEIKF